MASGEGEDGSPKPKPDPTSIEYYLQGLEEAAPPFLPVSPTVEERVAFYRQVLDGYGWTCALTGRRFEPEDGLTQDLYVTAIRPLELGGALAASNFIALSLDVSREFERGHIAVAPDHGIIVDLLTVDRQVAYQLKGILRLPAGMPPNEDALHWHRLFRFRPMHQP